VGVSIKGQQQGSLWLWKCDEGMYLDGINVSILVVILYYSFTRCCLRENCKKYTLNLRIFKL